MTARVLVALAVPLIGLAGCAPEDAPAPRSPAAPDSTAAAVLSLDTLRRLGAKDYVVDSLVRHGDTAIVWTGPREWMATDRPTTAVYVVPPGRVAVLRHILGG